MMNPSSKSGLRSRTQLKRGCLLLSTLLAGLTSAFAADDPPTVLVVEPLPDSVQTSLGFVDVTFTENVTGVNAGDLLINGTASVTNVVQVSPREYTFQFPQPPTGAVTVAWAPAPGIADEDETPDAFVPGAPWSYTVDPNAVVPRVIISEFLAENANGLRDEDGDRRDWIELFNPGTVDVSLGGWFLTDSATNLTQWQFPNVNLAPNRYLLVWASEKNKTNPAAPLHTNFKLTKDAGGYLALVNPGLVPVSQFISYPAQPPDTSYGRDRVDPSLVGYFLTPTPGVQNSTSGASFAPEPVFSLASGIYTNNSLTLTITVPAGVTVRYTYDGFEPATNSPIYSGPIVFGTNMVIKARAFSSVPGLWPSRVVARTFIVLDSTARDFNSNLPILVISTQGKALQQQVTLPFIRTRGTFISIDTTRGRSSLQAKTDFQGLGQFEIIGQTSAGFPKVPVRVELNDELGNDQSASLLGLPAEADWNLRNPYNDKSLMNDFLGYELWKDLGHYSCRSRFVELFLDTGGGKLTYPGDYYGIMVLFERIEIGKDRVDIAKLSTAHTNEPAISGGYIIKKDKDSVGDLAFSTLGGAGHSGQTLKFHDPKPREITTAQQNWIRNYTIQFEASMFSPNWTNATGTNHYSNYIDVDAFVDQQLHVEFTKQIDGYRLSSYYSKDRGGKLKPEPVWDWNLAFGNAYYLRGGTTNGWYWSRSEEGMTSAEHIWLRRLVNGSPNVAQPSENNSNGPGDPDFRQKITDRWAVVRQNALNGDRVLARIDELAALLTEAAARNYQKWPILQLEQWPNPNGAGKNGTLPPTEGWSVNYANQSTYPAIISEMKKWVRGRYLWMDSQFLPPPTISQPEGPIAPGTTVALAAAQGTVYYTLDGTDPRLPGGGISPLARPASSPIVLDSNARLVARSFVPGSPLWTTWSAPQAATYIVATPRLVITEIMYHPPPPLPGGPYVDEDFEYLELKNVGTTPLNLVGYTLSGGVQFTFPSLVLSVGQKVLVVKNQAAFTSRYGSGLTVAGEYTGNLANEGNRLVLTGRLREPILDFSYDDQWYPITDGFGFSLVIVNENAPANTWGLKASWRPSGVLNGTPGQDEGSPPNVPSVVINEALTHSDPAPDTIELRNLSSTEADIGGWYLTDDFRNPKKFRIPLGRTIPANGYVTFTELEFNAGGNGNIPFALSALGDELYLFSGNVAGDLTGYVHGFDYEAQLLGVTFGRHVISTGEEHFVAQASASLGSANAGPRVGPVVISEIMFRPQDILANSAYWNDTEHEYIELRNISASPVTLSDPARPTNTWKLDKAVEFTFPQSTTIPADGLLLVVNFDPITQPSQAAAFRAEYGISAAVAMVGPYQGSLDNDQGNVSLYMPDAPTTNGVIPFVLVDRVHYSDQFPWPVEADGVGQSLHRLNLGAYGDDPANWIAGGPTPGSGFTPGTGPSISSQPANASVGDSGTESTSFSATATGPGPLRYQWFFKGSILNGATASTLLLQNIKPSQAGEYRVVAMNPFGSALSAPAVLTVRVLPKILRPPLNVSLRGSTNNADYGSTTNASATFVVAVSGTGPIRYQWRRSGVNISGATGPALNIPNVTLADDGTYDVLVTDDIDTVATPAVRLSVLLTPYFVVVPVNQVITSNSTFTASTVIRGNPPPYRFEWREISTIRATNIVRESTNFFTSAPVIGKLPTTTNTWRLVVFNDATPVQGVVTSFSVVALADADGDGIPDAWETQFGLDPNNSADRDLDLDGDGLSNYAEYRAGTDPTSRASALVVDIASTPGSALLSIGVLANRTYTVQYSEQAIGGTWTRLADIPAASSDRVETVRDPAGSTSRFYRLVTPRQP